MNITIAAPSAKRNAADTIVFLIPETLQLGAEAKKLDSGISSLIQHAVSGSRFKGKGKESFVVSLPKGSDAVRAVLIGIGNTLKGTLIDAEAAGGLIVKTLNGLGAKNAVIVVDTPKSGKVKPADMAAHIALGAQLKAYRFDKYRTTEKPEKKPTLQSLMIVTDAAAEARKAWDRARMIAEGVYLTRDVTSEPPNVLYPETFAARTKKELAPLGIKVDIFDEAQLVKLGMGAFVGVGQGSVQKPKMVVLQYNGAKSKTAQPLAIVGKGITFDTGGISIKPSNGMEDMKWDMGGAGVVLGLFAALAKRKAKVNVVGIMALAENMPDGNAQRPGDVVTSMSGQTIEVLNTDAEGRLVLADALWYVQEKFKPSLIVDLATLTGAVIVALGFEYAGVMGNDDKLLKQLQAAGDAVDEKLWPLPLCEAFDEQINSKIADVQNISSGKGAGSSNGGQFLQRFIKDGQAWAHIDIAGVAWADKERPVVPVGASGFGVRLLDQFIAQNYEK